MLADDKDDNPVFACAAAFPVGAMLMPALGNKLFVFLPNWSPGPRIGAPIFKKNLVGAPIREWGVWYLVYLVPGRM